MSIDVDAVSDLIRDVSARVIDPRFRTLHDHQIHQKKPGDFVTAVSYTHLTLPTICSV